jgi:nucleotide-binding universal stress UspA family protein
VTDDASDKHRASVVVGVYPGQPDTVVKQAATFASRFDAQLVCAYVNAGRYVMAEGPDGSFTSMPFDPDVPDLGEEEFDPALREHLTHVLSGGGVSWETRALAGDPARALGQLADTVEAAMIVVGTRENTFLAGVQEFLAGSVAARLAHRQHRPVVVIPLNPKGVESSLPWEAE